MLNVEGLPILFPGCRAQSVSDDLGWVAPGGGLRPADSPIPEPAQEPAGIPEGTRVLIIEDNRDAADSLRLFLELLGHRVSVAYTGTEGLAVALEQLPPVILCDIGLPGMDGYAMLLSLLG
jgi:PleD family two-component response regulator